MRSAWSSTAAAKLRELYLAGAALARIAFLLKRSENSVKQRVRRLRLHRKRVGAVQWSKEKIRELMRRYPDELTTDLARDLGCSDRAAFAKAYALGLRKSDVGRARMAERSRLHALTDPRVIAGRIKPGAAPPNKGLRRPGWHAGRMRETQFKPGRPAPEARNYQPIGTEKIDPKRNAVVRKVTDDPSVFPAQRWQPVAKIVWEATHGAVPTGHIVRFRDGMKTLVSAEITLDRLELVTLAENMRRNSYHNRYPKEIGLAIQLRGQLVRQINKRTRREEQNA